MNMNMRMLIDMISVVWSVDMMTSLCEHCMQQKPLLNAFSNEVGFMKRNSEGKRRCQKGHFANINERHRHDINIGINSGNIRQGT